MLTAATVAELYSHLPPAQQQEFDRLTDQASPASTPRQESVLLPQHQDEQKIYAAILAHHKPTIINAPALQD